MVKRYQYQRFPEFLAKHATLRERTEHGGTRGQKHYNIDDFRKFCRPFVAKIVDSLFALLFRHVGFLLLTPLPVGIRQQSRSPISMYVLSTDPNVVFQ